MSRIRTLFPHLLLLLVPLGLVAVTSCSSPPPEIPRKHVTVDHAPRSMGAAGPPVGTYQAQWRRSATKPRGFQVVAGHLVVVSQTGVQAYNAQTGKPTWSYREPGREVSGWTADSGVVVVDTGDLGSAAGSHAVGLDARTGKQLWEKYDEWELSYTDWSLAGRDQGPTAAVDGVLVAAAEDSKDLLGRWDRGTRLGIDIRTGEELWRTSDLQKTGSSTPQTARRPLVVAARDDKGFTIAGVEPGSGSVVWHRRYVGGSPKVYPTSAATVVEKPNESAVEFIGHSGKGWQPTDATECAGCAVYGAGSRVVRVHDKEIEIFDVPNWRRTAIEVPSRFSPRDYALAGNTLFGLSDAGLPGLVDAGPAGLIRVDVRRGRVLHTPMPFSEASIYNKSPDERIVAAGNGRVYLLSDEGDAGTFVAYGRNRANPPGGAAELGGLRPDDWPDPCGLLKGIPKDRTSLDHPMPGEPEQVGGTTIRRTCSDGGVRVTVDWVAATDRKAGQMFDGDSRPAAGADSVARLEDGVSLVRVGRVVLRISGHRQGPSSQVVQTIAHNARG